MTIRRKTKDPAKAGEKSRSSSRTSPQDEQSATAVKYGLIAALIAVAAIVAMQNFGYSLGATLSGVSTTLDNDGTALSLARTLATPGPLKRHASINK
ncbi:MAG: Flp family type IVb pilin [Pseudomonadota bacterium]